MSTPETPEAPFEAPWQAQLFGLTVALNEQGRLPWPAWTQRLGAELATGAPYWDAWLRALEAELVEKGIARRGDLSDLAKRWQDAAHATPHGVPIRLENSAT